jgi:hypothetical protein
MKSFLAIVLFFFATQAMAGQGPFLLGAILGDPTGLSGRFDLDKTTAVDGALSWSGGGRTTGSQIHGDYLKTRPRALAAGDSFVDVYYGIGARMIAITSKDHKGDLSFGPRAPIGLNYELRDPSVEFFGEVALILDLAPSTAADIDLGVGVRYRF